MTRRWWRRIASHEWFAATPLVVGILAAAIVARAEPPHRSQAQRVFEIPAGTSARVAAGEDVTDIIPPELDTVAGAELIVRNHDVTNHVFGPFVLAPGQQWTRRFAMAGEYGFSCSVYPTVGFTIYVDPPADEPPLSGGLLRMWGAIVAALAALFVGSMAAALATGSLPEPGAERLTLEPPVFLAAAALLPGAVLAFALTQALDLSRISPWRDALTSRGLAAWVGALILAGFVSLAAGLLPRLPGYRAQVAAAGWLLAVALSTLIAVDTWGLAFATAGLAVAGAGFLGAAAIVSRREPAARVWPLAAAGAPLVLLGLPWPVPAPPVLGLAALALGSLGAGVAAIGARWPAWGLDPAAKAYRGLVSMSAFILVMAGFFGMYAAVVRYSDALSVPVSGNTVPADPDSISRGAAIWDDQCVECHAEGLSVDDLTDQAALQIIARGTEDMQGFGYVLGRDDRGDVLNYLRSLGSATAIR